jgi:hypothetical protein
VGLTDDQKAMLRLLAQREEGYEDMAKLMGISVGEVRERVKEALAEVDEAAGSPPVPAPATPPAPPAQAPVPPAPSSAPTPEPPATTPKPAKPAAPPKPLPRLPRPTPPESRGALIGLGAGALVVVVLVIVLVVGGGDESSEPSTAVGQGNAELTAAEERNLTQAVLAPTGDADASGRALFGRFKQDVLLQVEAEGLEPSPPGESYTVWLYRSPKLALQVGAVRVGESGKLAAQFQIPAQLLTYVANGSFDQVDVSLTPIAEYKAAFNEAKAENKVPPYVGESVLRGEITGPAVQPQR